MSIHYYLTVNVRHNFREDNCGDDSMVPVRFANQVQYEELSKERFESIREKLMPFCNADVRDYYIHHIEPNGDFINVMELPITFLDLA